MQRCLMTIAMVSLAMLVACGKDDKSLSDKAKEAAKDIKSKASEALESIDVSKLSPDAMKEKAGKVMSDAVAKLGDIKDAASAGDIAKKLTPAMDMLGKVKAAMGSGKFDFSALTNKAKELTSKFTGNAGVMDALKPLMDKIQALGG